MRYLYIALILFISTIYSGCCHCPSCPPQDVVTSVEMGGYLMPIVVEKGLFDKENYGSQWITMEEYKQLKMEQGIGKEKDS